MRRDAAIASVLALLAALALLFAVDSRAGGDSGDPIGTAGPVLPAGWHAIGRPLTSVTYPRQVLAAATYRIVFRQRPGSCEPTAALSQMPADGVLVQIIEYAPRFGGRPVRVQKLPPRPSRFAYADASYGRFECAGPSYRFVYRQDGRALQAQVWMNRRAVDPRSRASALLILDRFTPADSSVEKRG